MHKRLDVDLHCIQTLFRHAGVIVPPGVLHRLFFLPIISCKVIGSVSSTDTCFFVRIQSGQRFSVIGPGLAQTPAATNQGSSSSSNVRTGRCR